MPVVPSRASLPPSPTHIYTEARPGIACRPLRKSLNWCLPACSSNSHSPLSPSAPSAAFLPHPSNPPHTRRALFCCWLLSLSPSSPAFRLRRRYRHPIPPLGSRLVARSHRDPCPALPLSLISIGHPPTPSHLGASGIQFHFFLLHWILLLLARGHLSSFRSPEPICVDAVLHQAPSSLPPRDGRDNTQAHFGRSITGVLSSTSLFLDRSTLEDWRPSQLLRDLVTGF